MTNRLSINLGTVRDRGSDGTKSNLPLHVSEIFVPTDDPPS